MQYSVHWPVDRLIDFSRVQCINRVQVKRVILYHCNSPSCASHVSWKTLQKHKIDLLKNLTIYHCLQHFQVPVFVKAGTKRWLANFRVLNDCTCVVTQKKSGDETRFKCPPVSNIFYINLYLVKKKFSSQVFHHSRWKPDWGSTIFSQLENW